MFTDGCSSAAEARGSACPLPDGETTKRGVSSQPPATEESGMNNALILHIGYHRTGTKTLQRIVFPRLTRTAYFSTHSIPETSTPASVQITRSFGFSPEIWRQRGEALFRELIADVAELGRDGPVLISGESMSEP